MAELSKRFPEDFKELMETFQLSEDVLRDISAISQHSLADGNQVEKRAIGTLYCTTINPSWKYKTAFFLQYGWRGEWDERIGNFHQ